MYVLQEVVFFINFCLALENWTGNFQNCFKLQCETTSIQSLSHSLTGNWSFCSSGLWWSWIYYTMVSRCEYIYKLFLIFCALNKYRSAVGTKVKTSLEWLNCNVRPRGEGVVESNHGLVLDTNLTFDSHISHVSKSCFYYIRALRYIQPALADDVAKIVACSLVGSCLDYTNSVLFGISEKNLARLYHIQSTLARAVTMQRGWISISKTPSDLHWLPMKFQVDFKVATLTLKVLESGEWGY